MSRRLQDNGLTIMLSEYAAFSSIAYGESVPVPDGWNLFLQSTDCSGVNQSLGYFGLAYIKEYTDDTSEQKNIAIIISHRGTILSWGHPFTSIEEFIQDIEIAMGECPAQLTESALPFCQAVIDRIKTQYPKPYNGYGDVNISHTGHSLGAVLSDISHLCMYLGTDPSYEWEFMGM